MTVKELFCYSATDILKLFSSGKVDILEYANSLVERIKTKEPKVKAWEYFDEGMFLQKANNLNNNAKFLKQNRSLMGIPVGIKDIFNTADMPTGMGSPIWKDFTPGNNARVVDDIIYNGGLAMGKTVTAEFAVHHPGKTLNPHNAEYLPGTSSSGSAAAVASGMVPLALGTQTAGSTTRPASYCGVYGFKPSFGIVPRTAILKTLDTLDHVTFFSRNAADSKLLLDTVRVRGKNHPFVYESMDCEEQVFSGGAKIKVAFVKTHVWDSTQDYTKTIIESFSRKLDDLEGVEVEEVEIPEVLGDVHQMHDIVYTKALSYYFSDEYYNHKNKLSDSFRKMVERGQSISTDDYFSGLKHQVECQEKMDEFFDNYDLILSISTSGEAPTLIQPEEKPDTALIWTYVHTPSLSFPIAKGPNNMPVGIQLVSKRYNDYKLLSFIEHLENKEIIPPVEIV